MVLGMMLITFRDFQRPAKSLSKQRLVPIPYIGQVLTYNLSPWPHNTVTHSIHRPLPPQPQQN